MGSTSCVRGAGVVCARPAAVAARQARSVSFAVEAKKGDSVIKRQRQTEKRRLRNRARKSESKTLSKKVLVTVEELMESGGKDLETVDAQLADAYSAIDKAVSKNILHANTGARRKSRLAKARRELATAAGLYNPDE